MKVLLVEDNQGDARLIREMLGEVAGEQFDLVHAESLAAASKCLNETTVDVVLLDLSLPDSHGLDTFNKIHTQVPASPIVVLSGFGDETFAVEAVRQGAQDYLTKGKFDGNQLARAMRYAIERQRIENALKQSEEKLRVTFESINATIVITDTLGSIVQTNEAATRMTGYSREEIIGKSGLDLIDKKYHDMAVQTMMKVLEEGHGMESMELQFLTKDGKHVDAEFGTAMIRDTSGNPAGFVSIARDITERKKMEEVLRVKDWAIESAINAIAISDLAGNLNYVNTAFIKLWGYSSPAEVLGKSATGFWQMGEKAAEVMEALRARGGWHGELMGQGKDGAFFDVEVAASMVVDLANRPVCMLASFADITERKRMEEALRASEEKLRVTFESITDTIVITDTLGNIVQTNEAATRLSGYSREELIGKNGLDLIDPKCHDMAVQTMIKVFEEGHGMESMELQFLTKDGRYVDAEFGTAMIRDTSGNPAGFVSIARDITERKQMEHQVREQMKELQAFYGLAEITEREGITLDKLYQELTNILPKSWQYPEIACARIVIGDSEFRTENFAESPWKQSAPVKVNGPVAGKIEVGYLEERPEEDEGPFQKEERLLIDTIAERIGRITERKRLEEALRASEEKLRAMFKSTSDGIVVTDLRFNILEANEAAARIFGHKSKESLIGTSALGFISAEKIVDTDGKQIFIEFSLSQIRDAAGNLTGNIGIVHDITERKRAEEAIQQRNRELSAINIISQSLSQHVKPDDVLQSALDATLEVTGLPAGGIWLIDKEEQKLVLTVHKGVCERFIVAANKVPLGAGITGEVAKTGSVTVSVDVCEDMRVPHTLKSIANLDDLRALISVPLRSKGKTLGVMNIFDREPRDFPERDVRLLETIGGQIGTAIENAQLLEKLEEISITDKLTGLYNRRHFYEVLESEVNRTQRYGHPFSLVMLDLDGFKAYNDRFGHITGDEILKDFAATLEATLRKSDRAFRYGGDEFAIVLPSTDAAKANKLVDRFRTKWPQTVDGEFEIPETPLGFSAGIAQFPEDIDTLDGLIFMADAALYKAKREGKYRTDLASELGQLSAEVMASNH